MTFCDIFISVNIWIQVAVNVLFHFSSFSSKANAETLKTVHLQAHIWPIRGKKEFQISQV